MNIGILESSDFSGEAMQKLRQLGRLQEYKGGDLSAFLKNLEVVFVRLGFKLDAEILAHSPKLKYICSPTTGLNHIDLAYCRKRDIKILSLKGETKFLETIRATPEHTLGLILGLKRNYANAFLNTENREWNRDKYKGMEIYGSRVGIIGYGRVGKILSKYLLSLGATVGFYDIEDKKHPGIVIKYLSNKELISHSDTIILCASYDPQKGIIVKSREIEQMKGKYFVNTARAELTDEPLLIEKAQKNHFKGIAIDVIIDEQGKNNNLAAWLKAAKDKNIIITPHIGGATYSSMARTEMFMANKLVKQIGRS